MSAGQSLLAIRSCKSVDELVEIVSALQIQVELDRLALIDNWTRQEIVLETLFEEPATKPCIEKWKSRLAVELAGNNCCVVFGKRGVRQLMIAGKDYNVKLVRLMFILTMMQLYTLHPTGKKLSVRNESCDKIVKQLPTMVSKAREEADPSAVIKVIGELELVENWIKDNVARS